MVVFWKWPAIVIVAFCQKVRCGSNKSAKSPSWAENLNKSFTVMSSKFKFSAQDSDLTHLFEPHQTLWQKTTFMITCPQQTLFFWLHITFHCVVRKRRKQKIWYQKEKRVAEGKSLVHTWIFLRRRSIPYYYFFLKEMRFFIFFFFCRKRRIVFALKLYLHS